MTRREQYLKRRAKFMLRRERARSINSKWGKHPVTGVTIRKSKSNAWAAVGVQMPQRVSSSAYAWDDWPSPVLPGAPFVITKIGPRRPPHVSILPPFQRPGALLPSSADYPVVGYHRRRVQRWGRKPNRMTVFQRRVWAANMEAWRNGYFAEDDPLGRRPTGTDVQNGAPFLTEFPYAL